MDTIIGPFGGGGHLCGVAAAVKALKPSVKVISTGNRRLNNRKSVSADLKIQIQCISV